MTAYAPLQRVHFNGKFGLVLPICQNGDTLEYMKTLTLKIPDGLLAEIGSEARARNVSRSEVVRERLVRKPLTTRKGAAASLWTRMEDLVIQSDSLPVDLSSSKAALKDYGKDRSHR